MYHGQKHVALVCQGNNITQTARSCYKKVLKTVTFKKNSQFLKMFLGFSRQPLFEWKSSSNCLQHKVIKCTYVS